MLLPYDINDKTYYEERIVIFYSLLKYKDGLIFIKFVRNIDVS